MKVRIEKPKTIGVRNLMPFYRFLPNIITLMALCAGLTAVRFAIDGHWKAAMVAILVAAILDTMDGAVARLLKASSPIGAQLDSFSDFVAFGIAPAIILYLWVMAPHVILGWAFCLIFAVAVALRLARFNVHSAETPHVKTEKYYFEGVPSPAGAILALLPFYVSFEIGRPTMAYSPVAIGIWVLFVSALMLSRIPTFSLKGIRLPEKFAMPIMGFIAALIAALINEPWITLALLSIAYVISLPISYLKVSGQSAKFFRFRKSIKNS